jgi:hypothetical protein
MSTQWSPGEGCTGLTSGFLVFITNRERLMEAWRKAVIAELLVLPDEIHAFLMWRDWVRAYIATAEFFDRTLKRGEKIGSDD